MKSVLLLTAVLSSGWAADDPVAVRSGWDAWGAVGTPAVTTRTVTRPRTVLRLTPARRDQLAVPLAKLRRAGWSVHSGANADIQVLEVRSGSEMVYVNSSGAKVRELKFGCGDPVDQWAIGWLATGRDERPPGTKRREPVTVRSSGRYPIRGQWWSVEGDWNPSRRQLIRHLRGPNHRRAFDRFNLDLWTYAELMSAHSDHHEGGVREERRPSKAQREAAEVSVDQDLTLLGIPTIGTRQAVELDRRGRAVQKSQLRVLGIPLFGTRRRLRGARGASRAFERACPT